jgi:hypothetical protein
MKKLVPIENPRNLKTGDIIVYTEHGETRISDFTIDKEYSIQGFYESKYGVVLVNDSNIKTQICNDLVKDYFMLPVDEPDNVNHPEHYTSHPSGIECIEIARCYPFSIGNAIKYLWRAGLKKDASLTDNQKEIEDLKKAIWYISDRIKQLGGEI